MPPLPQSQLQQTRDNAWQVICPLSIPQRMLMPFSSLLMGRDYISLLSFSQYHQTRWIAPVKDQKWGELHNTTWHELNRLYKESICKPKVPWCFHHPTEKHAGRGAAVATAWVWVPTEESSSPESLHFLGQAWESASSVLTVRQLQCRVLAAYMNGQRKPSIQMLRWTCLGEGVTGPVGSWTWAWYNLTHQEKEAALLPPPCPSCLLSRQPRINRVKPGLPLPVHI